MKTEDLRKIANYVGYCPRSWGEKQQQELLKRVQEKIGVSTFKDALNAVKKAEKERQKEREKLEKKVEKERKQFAAQYSQFHDEIVTKGVLLTLKNRRCLERFVEKYIFDNGKCAVTLDKILCCGTDYDLDWNYYAKSCHFPHKDYRLQLGIPSGSKILFAGGMLNIVPKKFDSKKGCGCQVLVKGRGYNYEWKEQWLIRGYHSTAKTLELAQKQVARLRKEEAERLWSIRREDMNIRTIRAKNAHKIVTMEISQKAGNCYAGSSSFANRFGIELDAKIKLGDLYRIDKKNNYTTYLDKIAVWLEKNS